MKHFCAFLNLLLLALPLIGAEEKNPASVEQMIWNWSTSEPCGICKKSGHDKVAWLSPHGRYVHQGCFDLVKDTEKQFLTYLNKIFSKDIPTGCDAQIEAIESIEREINKHNCSSIKEYLDKHGQTSLKEVFDMVGAKAVARYAERKGKPAQKAFIETYFR